jgi:hypothetical protein
VVPADLSRGRIDHPGVCALRCSRFLRDRCTRTRPPVCI